MDSFHNVVSGRSLVKFSALVVGYVITSALVIGYVEFSMLAIGDVVTSAWIVE